MFKPYLDVWKYDIVIFEGGLLDNITKGRAYSVVDTDHGSQFITIKNDIGELRVMNKNYFRKYKGEVLDELCVK